MGKHIDLVTSFVAGASLAVLLKTLWDKKCQKNARENAGATVEGNDLSLFYGDQAELTKITNSRKYLPKELYGELVREAVVCCVDILAVRNNECLLVLRGTEPAKGKWWLPGGRLLKGETFFAAAQRKAQEETGLDNVKCVQVLGTYNTFFPTSHWDTPSSKGTQTVNAVVLVELSSAETIVLDETSVQAKWIPLNATLAEKNGEDRYVLEALRRLHAWNPTYKCNNSTSV